MQQCRYTFRLSPAECRCCNGLRAECPEYRANPDPKAARETDPEKRRALPAGLFPPVKAGGAADPVRWRPLDGKIR